MTKGFSAFAAVSGLGWLMDMGLTVALVEASLSPFLASLIGSGTAVSFVYLVSRLAFLGDGGIGRVQDFAVYAVWQVFAISMASVLVAALAHLLAPVLSDPGARAVLQGVVSDPLAVASGVAKAAVTPMTLLANYLFLHWLTGRATAPVAAEGRGAQ